MGKTLAIICWASGVMTTLAILEAKSGNYGFALYLAAIALLSFLIVRHELLSAEAQP